MTDPSQFELSNPPTDGISQVCFSPYDSNFLLVSSWDKTLRLYNVEKNELVHKFETRAPVLCCCFGPRNTVYYGGLDVYVYEIDLISKKRREIGKHENAVTSICWGSLTSKVYTGSWDRTLRVWNAATVEQVHRIDLPHKVFSMDLLDDKLAVAMGERKTHIYDILDMSRPWQDRETTLKFMLKCIRLMPNGEGYVCSSIEGRVSIEYFDMSEEVQKKKYAFKSHRQLIQDTEVVYPVNAIAFHPKYGTFASGGSDCVVFLWDGVNRKRLRQLNGFSDEIASLAFNKDGTKLAIASSYTFDEGERDHAPDAIFIKRIQDIEVSPRQAN